MRTLPARFAMPELFAPLPLVAVALLAFNDRVLKVRAPGALSGKLSDVAVCFFMPLVLSALVGLCAPRVPIRARVAAGSLVTAFVFVALELSDSVAVWFCRFGPVVARPLGISAPFRLWSDPTDLLCLVLVPLAYVYGVRRLRLARRFVHAHS